MRILVVDDDVKQSKRIAEMLKDKGYQAKEMTMNEATEAMAQEAVEDIAELSGDSKPVKEGHVRLANGREIPITRRCFGLLRSKVDSSVLGSFSGAFYKEESNGQLIRLDKKKLSKAEKKAQKRQKRSEFETLLQLAQEKGWTTPVNNAFPEHAWVNYWRGCIEHETNPEAGRPVPPHRPA